MERATDEIIPPQERPRTDGLQGETERTGQSSQGSSFNSHGTGDQFNAPEGKLNLTKGPGNRFPGATFHTPVYFGTKEHFDPLRECLRSLAFPEMDSRSNDIDAATQGTCEWLLRHKTYKSWASCDRGLLWIKGKPGSGKSTLLRHVLNHAMTIPNTGRGALVLSFFFHGRGSELQRTPFGLFRSLLHQLLRQVPEALTDLVATFQQRRETIGKPGEKWQWHPRELQRFFELSLLKVLKARPVWLFVDALDECGEENAVNLAEEFKSLLQRLSSSGLKQFRICFTCRHYPILDLDSVFEVCVEKENWKDISTFVQDKLSSFRGRTSSTIPELITNRAEGVFLWAWLMVKKVLDLEREGAGLKEIEAAILSNPQRPDAFYHEQRSEAFPPGLDSLHQPMMERIDKSDSEELCERILADDIDPDDADSMWETSSVTSIGSSSTLVGSSASGPVQSGLRQALSFLLDNEALYPLFQTAIQKPDISVDRFRRNLVRVLGYLGTELKLEATTSDETTSAAFFRNYRLPIALGVSMRMAEKPLEPITADQSKKSEGIPQDNILSDDGVEEEVEDDEKDESEGEDTYEEATSKQMADEDVDFESVKAFILSSDAFKQMLRRLSDFIYPSFRSHAQKLVETVLKNKDIENDRYWIDMELRLRVVLAELEESRPQQIMLDLEPSVSRLDRFMAIIESITGEKWNWWPLASPKYPLGLSEKCNDTRWEVVPAAFAGGISRLVQKFPLANQQNAVPPTSSISAPSSPSTNAGLSIGTRAINTPGSPGASTPIPLSSLGSETQSRGQNQHLRPRYIFLVATCERHKLHQLPSLYLSTYDFGQELRDAYYQLKGFWRSWFSPYGFAHCDFVKFEKFSGGFAHRGLEIPATSQRDYYYAPRPALRDPPISPEEFGHIYTSATRNQRPSLAWALPFSTCIDELSEDTVDCIPQRYCYLNEKCKDRELFWGLYIQERRSALMTSMYILLCLSPFLIFCVLYLFGLISGDVQNATTPLALALTSLSLFLGSLIKG